jgi:hypothetical protein
MRFKIKSPHYWNFQIVIYRKIAVMNWRFESKNIFLFPDIIHGKINNFEKIQSKLETEFIMPKNFYH